MGHPVTHHIRSRLDTERRHFWIGGAWQPPACGPGGPHTVVADPTGREAVGRVPQGTPEDVSAAVAAARAAFPAWSAADAGTRRELLAAVARGILDREAEFAAVISAEMGAPVDNALHVQTRLAAEVFRSYADLLADHAWEQRIGTSQIVQEPVGVVAAITPWNYPLYLIAAKVAAALAAGCTVVLKPSCDAPLNAFLLAGIFAEVCPALGVPGGVFNLVTGSGAVVGAALSSHSDVDAVSFTGSTGAGRSVAASAAGTVKRVGLELGGKSARVILVDEPDGTTVQDLEGAVRMALSDAFYNSGQTCTACSRVLVPDAVYDRAVALAAEEAGRWELGDPAVAGDHLGPVATPRQYAGVLAHIEQGVAEGARLVIGGKAPPDRTPAGLGAGHWILPTVFADVTNDMVIAREEIFGPVVCFLRYRDEQEAVRIANDSIYGLAGAVWCTDRLRAERFARQIRAGLVTVNSGQFNVLAPTGGYKQSGIGRELGTAGLHEFTETKTIQW
ncbi:aldehyde dehydrogenase family protein [Streptomyces sp. RKAG337]|uniref:aldehyde dehydrogenase family protein n=1 Tax=Streptomyces sp. RKAG337 TaxID=2893404 RepID=UPI0020335909|nr:aldehyde dehydrogenase family protein [Streptomyces sp. RKAG337]MCM2424979.1 aldehyde dehydrogenase family protein [Streptomyces sp. RKAG337]